MGKREDDGYHDDGGERKGKENLGRIGKAALDGRHDDDDIHLRLKLGLEEKAE